jgi:hypothetical protein
MLANFSLSAEIHKVELGIELGLLAQDSSLAAFVEATMTGKGRSLCPSKN